VEKPKAYLPEPDGPSRIRPGRNKEGDGATRKKGGGVSGINLMKGWAGQLWE